MNVYVPYECLVTCRSQKKASDPLEMESMELWMGKSLHVDAGNRV